MSDMQRDAFEEAKELGLDCVLPGSDELFVDIDSEADLEVMAQMLGVFSHNNYDIEEVRRTRSKSGNTHVYLRAPQSMSKMERILLQAVLGSDRKREALAYLRDRNGNEYPTVFFEVPPGGPRKPVAKKKR